MSFLARGRVKFVEEKIHTLDALLSRCEEEIDGTRKPTRKRSLFLLFYMESLKRRRHVLEEELAEWQEQV